MFKLDVADVLVPVSATVTGNKSLLMMLRTGWIPGHSLGKRRGLLKPITLNTKNDNTGLGYLKYDVCNRLFVHNYKRMLEKFKVLNGENLRYQRR